MYLDQTEKVDVYSLGNIFYMLLQEEWPFQDLNETEAIQQIIKGARPSIDKAVWESQDPVDQDAVPGTAGGPGPHTVHTGPVALGRDGQRDVPG